MKNEYLRVGVISSAHGVHGEVNVFPTTDDAARFNELKTVLISDKNGYSEQTIEQVKFFKNMVILKLSGINDRDEAEKYRNRELYVTRDMAVPLEEGEYFICDIIGASVITDEGVTLGTIKDVLQTGANDVYVVETAEKKEVLLPVIPQCILDIDVENSVVKAHLMPGLLEL